MQPCQANESCYQGTTTSMHNCVLSSSLKTEDLPLQGQILQTLKQNDKPCCMALAKEMLLRSDSDTCVKFRL
jgi:hypothetical protein